MKKFFLLFAVAVAFVACNDTAENTETKDSTTIETTTPVITTPDTNTILVDTPNNNMDTTNRQ